MKNQSKPVSRQTDIVVQDLTTETLVYDLKDNKAFCLNKPCSIIWQLCNGQNTITEISQIMKEDFCQQVNEGFVWIALDQLKKADLLTNGQDLLSDFETLSRRQIVKKIGIASMITLPLVINVAVPSAAQAQSGVCVNPLPSSCLGGSPPCCINLNFPCCPGFFCAELGNPPIFTCIRP